MNLQMMTAILDVYGNPNHWEAELAKDEGSMRPLAAMVFQATIANEVNQSRELAILLAASAKMFMPKDMQEMVIASAEPIISRFEDC